tara:strand:+ start:5592 stop:6683 length:1092 start_codon:yes stop_codon:yes gene_type:complete
MSVFEIDHENLVVEKIQVLDRTLFSIDNFYKYPHRVLNYVKTSKMPPSTDFYPGNRGAFTPKNMNECRYIRNHVNDLKRILSKHGFDHSRFMNDSTDEKFELVQFSELVNHVMKEKKYKNELGVRSDNAVGCNPHSDADAYVVDDNKLACVCYLSRNTHGGTGIYRNRKTGSYCTDKRAELKELTSLKEKLDNVSCERQRRDIIHNFHSKKYNDTMPKTEGIMNDTDEHFELLHLLQMKFNRLVVYEGDLLHSIYIKDENFFKNNERKTTNYLMSLHWGYKDDDKNRLESKEILDLKDEIHDCMTQIMVQKQWELTDGMDSEKRRSRMIEWMQQRGNIEMSQIQKILDSLAEDEKQNGSIFEN